MSMDNKKMICPVCQKELPDGSKFCQYCGQKIKDKSHNHSKNKSTIWNSFFEKVYSFRKYIIILTIIIFIVTAVFLIWNNSLTSERSSARAHYYATWSNNQYYIGCGVSGCYFCQGIRMHTINRRFSPEVFPLYSKLSNKINICEDILFLLCTILILLVSTIIIAYCRHHKKEKQNHTINLTIEKENANLE